MAQYYLALGTCVAVEVLTAMGVIHYVDVLYSRADAYDLANMVGPVALLAVGLTVALFDGWHCRLVVERMEGCKQ